MTELVNDELVWYWFRKWYSLPLIRPFCNRRLSLTLRFFQLFLRFVRFWVALAIAFSWWSLTRAFCHPATPNCIPYSWLFPQSFASYFAWSLGKARSTVAEIRGWLPWNFALFLRSHVRHDCRKQSPVSSKSFGSYLSSASRRYTLPETCIFHQPASPNAKQTPAPLSSYRRLSAGG